MFEYVTQVRRLLSPQYRVLRVADNSPVCLLILYLLQHFIANILYSEWTITWTQPKNRFSFPSEAKYRRRLWGLASHLFSGCHEHFPLR